MSSSISSPSAVNTTAYRRPVAENNYETHARAFGPVVASAIGAVEAGADAASAVVSFSAESLEKLGDAIESGVDTVSSALGTVGEYAALGVSAGRQLFGDIV